ncbi:3-hydroxyacyl-acyl-carrier-protein dehydratase FabZ [Bosea sp. BIWAKO-01]|nr:3-hydroxyacyl-acyl-carrier-protein dehydratase FabZ [Bosea sp. BIWAKO-01]
MRAKPAGLRGRRESMTDATTSLGVADIQKIMACIPHRYPFLLVDRVIEMNGDESGIGIKNVTANEPQFTGHFPGRPVFPGVLMIEAMAQTAGVLVVSARGIDEEAVQSVLFTTIDKAKFRKPVVPGDTLRFHLTKVARKRNIWFYRGEAKVDGVLVAEAEISAMVA